jgi:hypothetical protein
MQAIRHNRVLPLRVVPPKRCRRFHDYLGTGKPCWPPEVDFSFIAGDYTGLSILPQIGRRTWA